MPLISSHSIFVQLFKTKTVCRLMSSTIPTKWLQPPHLEEVKAQFRSLEGGHIVLTQDEASGIAYLFLDHQDKKNSLSGKMMVDLNDAVTSLEKWENGKGLILHSNGDIFCSGGYLETVKHILTGEGGFRMSCLMHDSVNRLHNLPLVSVALVQGKALGGGAELTLATDFRLFTSSTEIGFVQSRMGVSTGWAGGTLLKSLVGHTKALDILLTGRKILPEEALKIGLCDDIIPNDKDRLEEAVKWLNVKIQAPVNVVRGTKLNMVRNNFDEERQVIGSLWGSDIHCEKIGSNIKHK